MLTDSVHYPGSSTMASFYWDETECLNYYGMLSLHEVFEIVGSQLTETDIRVLSFLLNETFPGSHPLDPSGWTVEPHVDDPDDEGIVPNPELLNAWRRLNPPNSQCPSAANSTLLVASFKPTSGPELLLELERRGYLSDGNLAPLLQLLRVLTRHDLLPFVSHKKRRTVSPERTGKCYRPQCTELVSASENDIHPPMPEQTTRRRRKKRGHGWSRKPKKTNRLCQPLPTPQKASYISPERTAQRHASQNTEFVSTSGNDIHPAIPGQTTRKRRNKRGHGWSRKPKKISRLCQPLPPPQKVSCS
ncbi:uncharacterized protein V6R79_018922 [Siganus canaliculatus]